MMCVVAYSYYQYSILKYGYGKVTDHINRDIRFKRINRNDAIKIVTKYENIVPKDLDIFFKWIGITKKKFYSYFKKNKIEPYYKNKTIFSKEIGALEKTLNYKQTIILEKEDLDKDYIIFGRTYMDKKNYKAVEG